MKSLSSIALVGLLLCPVPPGRAGEGSEDERIARLESRLEGLARRNRIPGMSAAVVEGRKILWARGFGFADLEREAPATESTLYRLASVSKPLAAVLLLQLVEEGKLSLDRRMNGFTIHPWFEPGSFSGAHFPERYSNNPITVRHVLTHTSGGKPGTTYSYDGNVFNDLTWVVEHVAGSSYPTVLHERIVRKAGMERTPPGHIAPDAAVLVRDLASPYRVVNRRAKAGTYPGFGLEPGLDVSPWNLGPAFELPEKAATARKAFLGKAWTPLHSTTAAAGVVSTVLDLARFDIALEEGKLLGPESRRRMFTAARAPDGTVLPYGLGWFVEEGGPGKIAWHYGWFPPTVSALYVKLLEKGAAFVLLANSDQLSAGFAWTQLGVKASPYARAFLEEFGSSG